MASLALHLKSHPHNKPSYTLLKSTIFSHLYSSSSSSSNNNNGDLPSYLNDIKSKLKQQQPLSQPSPTNNDQDTPVKPYPFSTSLTDINSKVKQHPPQHQSTSIDEIRKNLSEFRLRASGGGEKRTRSINFDVIRDSLNQLNISSGDKIKNNINSMSFNSSLKSHPTMPDHGGVSNVIGGSGLPMGVFGKEMREKEMKKGKGDGVEAELWMRPYNVDELGKKLKELRPEEEENGFSISELNERLKKIMENDDIEYKAKAKTGYTDMRRSLRTIQTEPKTNIGFAPIQGFDILGPGTPSFMLSPPKEHLVEKYFHPDNMSAEEKLKLELKKVRDEFKMHESDCGSARVQIAQLTTEILHLSSVLHKKDKHSRRGLQHKVQQRKKLLKYLRRTDWDSYCFVLSKLGLRDNPDYKN